MAHFTSKAQLDAHNKMVLWRGNSKDGEPFYAYIRCNEKQLFKMKQDYHAKNTCKNALEYGEVVYIALGKEPDTKAKDFLKDYLKKMG